MQMDCVLHLFSLQCKSLPRDFAQILQGERETLLARVGLVLPDSQAFPLHQSEAAEDAPDRANYHSQCVRVPVAVVAKVNAPKPLRLPRHQEKNVVS
jgi:hypothetical protein